MLVSLTQTVPNNKGFSLATNVTVLLEDLSGVGVPDGVGSLEDYLQGVLAYVVDPFTISVSVANSFSSEISQQGSKRSYHKGKVAVTGCIDVRMVEDICMDTTSVGVMVLVSNASSKPWGITVPEAMVVDGVVPVSVEKVDLG